MRPKYSDIFQAKICAIDDEPANLLLLRRLLEQAGYQNIETFSDSVTGYDFITKNEIDLLLLDLQMPRLSGFDILKKLKPQSEESEYTPIMVLTADATTETKRQTIQLGAHDFITKPFDAFDVVLRVKNLVRSRLATKELSRMNGSPSGELGHHVFLQEKEEIEIIEKLNGPAECPHEDAKTHRDRIGEYASKIAAELGLPEEFVHDIKYAAQLYDVGKIGISNEILLKPGKLSDEEFEAMKRHTEIGASILSGSNSAIMTMAEQIAFSHHERWDGRGYPCGLSQTDIPLCGRIVSVVDVFDALTHDRSYKKAWSVESAIESITENSGSQFDPDVVDAFLRIMFRELKRVA